ncbi:ribosomal RNA processing protein 1 homolog isoform X2 [Bombus huntii]|uniref:ribosomal RNA processing protein 1 homolog isoform X2 n=1 Tax=Bombus huntii TaxID=85661 RepID=UPI0021A97E28|nr:ribosomal RNA processing protein 1 homolog isoform X2 [Bombus huntii]
MIVARLLIEPDSLVIGLTPFKRKIAPHRDLLYCSHCCVLFFLFFNTPVYSLVFRYGVIVYHTIEISVALTKADFMRLWKGLFYYMWMSDKPLIQEELAESLSKIVHCLKTKEVVLLYTECVLRTLGIEWFGIDQYRLDKFCMLVRRIIRQTFQKCKENLWDIEWVKDISEILEKLLVDPKICIGFTMHITEIYLEELAKISDGNIPENAVTEFIKPFISYLIPMDDERQIKHVMRHIFRYLIFQSDIGVDYMEKFKAWRSAGFPAGSIDAMEKIEVSDEEDNNITRDVDIYLEKQMKYNTEKPLDPRAGRIDVELPQIPFNPRQIADLLNKYKFHSLSTTKSRRQLRRLIKEFIELSDGKMPLGIKEIRIPKMQKKNTDIKSAAVRLLKFEQELYSDTLQEGRKRKKNKQLIQDESDKFSEEESENINDETNHENNTVEMNNDETIKKKREMKHKLDFTDNLINTNSQILDENNPSLKKRKSKTNDENKKIKLKKNKNIAAKTLNIVKQVKRKKSTKSKVTGKWNVSDNIEPSTLLMDNNSTKSCMEIDENSVTSNHEQRNNVHNKQPTWLVPILTKLENKKNETPISLKRKHEISTTTSSKKRVKIALHCNTAQHTSEYISQIRKSPAIPFDANKKPLAGVLKASPIPSPINPFYRKNM